jgi:hypothetical protein
MGGFVSALSARLSEGTLPAARILMLYAHPAFERARDSTQRRERLPAAEFHGIEPPDESQWDSNALCSAHPRAEQP